LNEVIKINNLSFAYPDGQPALSGLSLTVGQGESVAVIGPNGAGKSTLLLHLNGILHNNGTVRVFDRPVNDKNLRWVRSRVGLVFQDPDDQLFSPTVFDDVAFGPINMGYSETEVHRAVSKALEWVGMAGYEKRSSHHLSIGERKRIAIATVLSMNPQILALDEPSGNLDPRSKWSLISLLRRLPMTKIVATHDLELVRALCSRTVILDRGQIVIDGATNIILNDKPLLAAHGLAPQPAS